MLVARKIMDRKSYVAAWRALNRLVTSSLHSLYRMVKIELSLLFR